MRKELKCPFKNKKPAFHNAELFLPIKSLKIYIAKLTK